MSGPICRTESPLTVPLPSNTKVGDSLRLKGLFRSDTAESFRERICSQHSSLRQPSSLAERVIRGHHLPRRKLKEHAIATRVSLPNIVLVEESMWSSQTPVDKYTSLRIGVSDDVGGNNGDNSQTQDIYDFKINMDNVFLKSGLKVGGDEVEMIRATWKYGLVLIWTCASP